MDSWTTHACVRVSARPNWRNPVPPFNPPLDPKAPPPALPAWDPGRENEISNNNKNQEKFLREGDFWYALSIHFSEYISPKRAVHSPV